VNNENLKGHGFHERSASEQREIARMGGKASGEARRRKADFRRTLNLLLTAKIDNPEWKPFLESMGAECTVESSVNAAMIKEALMGNVKAYEAIAKYSGQTTRTDEESEDLRAGTDLKKSRKKVMDGDDGMEDLLSRAKEILDGVDSAF